MTRKKTRDENHDNRISTSINHQVSVIVNGKKPYRLATASDPSGSDDYSKWNFTLIPNYTVIEQYKTK